jgi:branched-chain amino acid transport system substrate-binding protein
LKRLAAIGICVLLATVPLSSRAADPYQIVAILSETGSASFIGTEEAAALRVAETLANKAGGIRGRPVQFVIEDDQSSPQVSVQLMNAAVSKGAAVVLGSSIVASCRAMAPLAKDGPVQYCLSPGIQPPSGSYLFSSSIPTASALAASAVYFRERGWRKIAIITSTDATGQEAEQDIDAAFNASNGQTIVSREHFNITDVSVSAQMAHVRSSGAQALIAWSTGTPTATLLRGEIEANVDLPTMIGNGNSTYAQMKAYGQFLPKELYFAVPPFFAAGRLPNGPVKNAVSAFVAAFAAAGIKPDIGQALAWDPAFLTIDALKRLGPEANAQQIKSYLENLRGWNGIDGTYDFRSVPQRGVGINSVVITRWDPVKQGWTGMSKMGGMPLK